MVSSQEELKRCEREMKALKKAVEDADDPSRLRLLPGDNPTHQELNQKLDKVEVLVGSEVPQVLSLKLDHACWKHMVCASLQSTIE